MIFADRPHFWKKRMKKKKKLKVWEIRNEMKNEKIDAGDENQGICFVLFCLAIVSKVLVNTTFKELNFADVWF